MAKRAEPPVGSPWDDPLAEAPFVFVDCEMTGLKAATDRVVELCAERVRAGTVVGRLETLTRPESNATGNIHVHGLDAAALAGAPTFAEIVDPLLDLLDGAIFVAHAAAWDVAFVEAELARAGRPRPIGFYLDTLNLSRRALVLESHSLSALCAALQIERARAHRAGDDVRALRAVFDHVVGVLAPRTPRDLWHVRIGERHARPEVVEAAVAAVDRGVPVIVRYRPARRGPEDLTMQLTAVRTDLDPPRILGYLLPSRGRRELRADRILAIDPAPGTPAET